MEDRVRCGPFSERILRKGDCPSDSPIVWRVRLWTRQLQPPVREREAEVGDRPEMENKALSRDRVDLEREVANVGERHDRRAVDSVGRAESPRWSSPLSAFQVFHRSLELPLLRFDLSALCLT